MFVDGRYTLQARTQCADDFKVILSTETPRHKWLRNTLKSGNTVAYDPWLHTADEIEALKKALDGSGIALRATENLIDNIWADQPDRPQGQVIAYPEDLAGKTSREKCRALAAELSRAGQSAAVLTLPDSICWLLNIRGSDIPRNPIVQAFAILHATGAVELFSDTQKFVRLKPEDGLTLRAWDEFEPALQALQGDVLVDKSSIPVAVVSQLAQPVLARDPCILPKACKNEAELNGTKAAHIRDAAAMVEFLAWLDAADYSTLSEIDVVTKLESFREATGALRDISFETICGSGPNGAIVHYRVTEETNRKLDTNSMLLIDSGGQYIDGTTDITRTVALGTPTAEMTKCFTAVLRGMISVSRVKFPKGGAGRDLDPLARQFLWSEGLDFGHGTGHGVGIYLCVHEGPQRISRASHEPLQAGMILSNEPGYYVEDEFGIRIENLVIVRDAAPTRTPMMCFETLTWVPIDRRLIDTGTLSADERAWLNAYHADTSRKLSGKLSKSAAAWLELATAPL
jgi:Xaa-Pro aminopeptidase